MTETATAEPKQDLNGELVKLSHFEGHILQLRDKFADVDPAKDMDRAREARRDLVTLRGTIEKTRLALGNDARAFLVEVNATGNRLIDSVVAIEDPIDSKIKAIEMERIRIRDEKQAEIRRKNEEEARIKVEAEQAEARKKFEADKADMDAKAAEMKALADDLKKQREAFERQQMEEMQRRNIEARRQAEAQEEANRKLRAEETRLVEQKRQQDEEARMIAIQKAQIEAKRLAAIKAVEEHIHIEAERQRQEVAATEQAQAIAHERAEAKKVRQADLEARMKALAPDIKKMKAVAKKFRAVADAIKPFQSVEATQFMVRFCDCLRTELDQMECWPMPHDDMIQETFSRR